MRVLIPDIGQHVTESVRWLSRSCHQVVQVIPPTKRMGSIIKRLAYSRYLYATVESRYLNPLEDPIGWYKFIKSVYDFYSCDVFYPFAYKSVTAYIQACSKADFQGNMRTPYGNNTHYWEISDKLEALKLAQRQGVTVPDLFGVIQDLEDISHIKITGTRFPVVLKRTRGVGIRKNVRISWSPNDLTKALQEMITCNSMKDKILIQEYVPGDVFDVGGFAIDGELYCAVPQRRTITLPLRGGVAAVNDTIEDKRLIHYAEKMMKASKWSGPFQVEFRYDPRIHEYKLMEINAKMWGSLPLSLRTGPNILEMALRFACNLPVKKKMYYKKGIRYRWLLGQELIAMAYASKSDWIQFFLRFFKRSYYDIDLKDILPDLLRAYASICAILFKSNIPRPLLNKEQLEAVARR